METTVKLYTLGYSRVKTYVTALLFVAGNIVLPHFSPGAAGRSDLAAHLFLHPGRGI